LKKQAKVQARLQAELTDVRKLNAKWEREVRRVTASRAEIEQAVTDLTARLVSVQTNVSVLQEQADMIKQVQADVEKENRQARLSWHSWKKTRPL